MKKVKKNILLKEIKLINPENNSIYVSDVLISNEKIILIDKNLNHINKAETLIYNCKNLFMSPGILDMRVYLNGSDEENINTLLDVATKSGILQLITAPNQINFLDNPIKIEHLYEKSKKKFMPKLFTFGFVSVPVSIIKYKSFFNSLLLFFLKSCD